MQRRPTTNAFLTSRWRWCVIVFPRRAAATKIKDVKCHVITRSPPTYDNAGAAEYSDIDLPDASIGGGASPYSDIDCGLRCVFGAGCHVITPALKRQRSTDDAPAPAQRHTRRSTRRVCCAALRVDALVNRRANSEDHTATDQARPCTRSTAPTPLASGALSRYDAKTKPLHNALASRAAATARARTRSSVARPLRRRRPTETSTVAAIADTSRTLSQRRRDHDVAAATGRRRRQHVGARVLLSLLRARTPHGRRRATSAAAARTSA